MFFVQHSLNNRFAFRSTPPFHRHFIIHPVLFIYVHQCEKSCFHNFAPVAFIIIHPSNHWSIMCENMYNTCELFIPENASGNVIYFMLAWLGCDMFYWHSSYHRVHV
jgi:hypothetical protein